MGSSNWNAQAYTSYSRSAQQKTRQQIFTNTSGCHPDLNPAKFAIRESVDSQANPNSTPVIVCVDETGSMGHLAETIIKRGLGVIVEGILDRKPITDPHILLAAVGDAYCDNAPIQTTQFEADVVILEQIEKFFLEGNGGGNGGESYPLVWWFALNKTHCDAINIRKRKGYLFTVGDETFHPAITKEQLNTFLDAHAEADVDIAQLLQKVQTKWHVFHLITPTATTHHEDAISKWRELLGERAIEISDHTKLGEIVVSIMQVNEGHDVKEVLASWDGSTSLVVGKAVSGLAKTSAGKTEIVKI